MSTPKGYVIANVDVRDLERYREEYVRHVEPTVRAHGGRFVIRGAAPEVVEGAPRVHRFVVLEFPTLDDARRWYDSPEYRPLRAKRQELSTTDLFFIAGYAEQ